MMDIKWKTSSLIKVLKQAEEVRSLVPNNKERKKIWVGYLLRSGNLVQRVVEGRLQGKPTRGIQKLGCCLH